MAILLNLAFNHFTAGNSDQQSVFVAGTERSHMPHVEERQACMGTVVQFLDEACSVPHRTLKTG